MSDTFSIHDLLDIGDIIANDDDLDVLFIYTEDHEVIMMQGDFQGRYTPADTCKDVPDNEDDLQTAIDTLSEPPA